MAKLLLNLRDVPDDEADEVRALLEAQRIATFETRPSRWGVSAGSIWIVDDEAAIEAARLLSGYQANRAARARATHAVAQLEGTAPTLWSIVSEQPGKVLVTLLSIVLVLAVVALPVFLLSR